MITLIDHFKNLCKHCNDSPEDILWSILRHDKIIDEDSLLVYYIESYPSGKELNIMWGDGDGRKIEEWATKIAKENGCHKMYAITRRWKSFMRRFPSKCVAVILEREVI